MSSGYYPLDETTPDKGTQRLVFIRDELKNLLATRGDRWGRNSTTLPASWDNDVPEDAASDGHYEAKIHFALRLIEDCFIKPKDDLDQLKYLVEVMLDNDPGALIADNGVTVLDAWRPLAAQTLGRKLKKVQNDKLETFPVRGREPDDDGGGDKSGTGGHGADGRSGETAVQDATQRSLASGGPVQGQSGDGAGVAAPPPGSPIVGSR